MSRKKSSTKKNIAQAEILVQELPLELRDEINGSSALEIFGITIDDDFVRTPHGALIAHEDYRAMRELAAELEYSDELDATKISLYGLISTKIEFVDKNRQDFSNEMLTYLLLNDPVFKPCAGPEVVEQMKYLGAVVDYIRGNGFEYPNLPQIPIDHEALKEWFGDDGVPDFINDFQPLVEFVQNSIWQLSNYQMSVFLTVAHVFDSPVLAIMLANRIISSNEFAVIYLTTLAINSKIWGETDRQEERALLEIYTKQAEIMLRFIDQFSPKLTKAEKIIQINERQTVEFKSTMRWNIKTQQHDKAIEHEVLKTIVGFLNADGGVLLVGVENDGNVLGIALDGFQNEDKYLLYFKDLVVNNIGKAFLDVIKYDLEPAKGKQVLLVECKRSLKPAFVKHDKGEDFYVRSGSSTNKLLPSEMIEYSRTRFHNQ